MKKLLFALICCFTIVACSSPTTPSQVATAFVECTIKGDFDGAKKYVTTPTANLLDMALSLAGDKLPKEEGAKISDVSESIDGEKATVTMTVTKSDGSVNTDTIDLIKEDGNWKVTIGK